jgi:hypothetical protein
LSKVKIYVLIVLILIRNRYSVICIREFVYYLQNVEVETSHGVMHDNVDDDDDADSCTEAPTPTQVMQIWIRNLDLRIRIRNLKVTDPDP